MSSKGNVSNTVAEGSFWDLSCIFPLRNHAMPVVTPLLPVAPVLPHWELRNPPKCHHSGCSALRFLDLGYYMKPASQRIPLFLIQRYSGNIENQNCTKKFQWTIHDPILKNKSKGVPTKHLDVCSFHILHQPVASLPQHCIMKHCTWTTGSHKPVWLSVGQMKLHVQI